MVRLYNCLSLAQSYQEAVDPLSAVKICREYVSSAHRHYSLSWVSKTPPSVSLCCSTLTVRVQRAYSV